MLKHTIEYKDFNGADRREDLYFNLTEFDLVEMQAESVAGIDVDFKNAVDNKDVKAMLDFIKKLVHRSFGIKSADGKYHEKSPEIIRQFENSALYSDLIMDLFTDGGKKGAKFISELMPASLIDRATAQMTGADVVATNEGFQVRPSARDIFAEQVSNIEKSQENAKVANDPEFDPEEYKAFVAARRAQQAEGDAYPRPPHETGQGYQQ